MDTYRTFKGNIRGSLAYGAGRPAKEYTINAKPEGGAISAGYKLESSDNYIKHSMRDLTVCA
jgi:hypothetical protein